MSLDLTVLGCSGSYASPEQGPCSGYLVQSGATSVWMDCGNGTFEALQRHVDPAAVGAVVISHRHPDHAVDITGMAVMLRYFRDVEHGPPVYAPTGVGEMLAALWEPVTEFFAWREIGDGDAAEVGDLGLRFSRTDHPPPTMAVEVEAAGRRLVYTADTGSGWSATAFGRPPDLLLAEATYQEGLTGAPLHLTAAEAGAMASECGAGSLMLTHLGPNLDPEASMAEAAAHFSGPVTLARPGLRVRI